MQKQSIFSRPAKFVLPTNNRNWHSSSSYKSASRILTTIKKDVPPRKDFSNAQKLVNNYLEKNKNLGQFRTKSQFGIHKDNYEEIGLPHHELHSNLHEEVTETMLHTAEDKVINYNEYSRNKNSTSVTVGRDIEDSDRRLMDLLNNLEKEVRTIELHGSEKKIVDAKIREIYGKVVGKPDNLIESRQRNLNKDYLYDSSKETKINSHNNRRMFDNNYKNEVHDRNSKDNLNEMRDLNDDPYDKYSGFEYNRRPLSRNQNTIRGDERRNYYNGARYYNRPKMLSSYEDLTPYGKYNDDIKIRNTYKNDLEGGLNRNSLNQVPKRNIKNQRTWDNHDDPLSTERRRYYQNKLENLERRLQNTRSYKRRTDVSQLFYFP